MKWNDLNLCMCVRAYAYKTYVYVQTPEIINDYSYQKLCLRTFSRE